MEFVVNEKFSSLEELESKIEEFSAIKHVLLQRRDSRTLENAVKQRRISGKRVKNRNLVYYEGGVIGGAGNSGNTGN